MLRTLFLFSVLFFTFSDSFSQQFDRQDSLRGMITPQRAWWDLTYYHLDITVDPGDSSITGSNTIQYKVLDDAGDMQIDLQPPMRITKVIEDGKEIQFEKDGNAHFIKVNPEKEIGKTYAIEVFYSGNPRVSPNPPWSGGITWQRDEKGNPFVASSCQGDGASLWWPCKDHMYDEPDSMLISVAVPKGLMDVSNGRLRDVEKGKDYDTFHWYVNNPINNYGVNINIANYTHFSETYDGLEGPLDVDYYVLPENKKKAKKQFEEVPRMLEAFEYWFGPYPFYEDGYKLVEVPYLGMEHQSSVTYGNGYQNGYLGRDLSQTGWGLKFDFIIVHESGHEWFANNITYKDAADMWVHEGFTAYSENLFLDYYFGKEAASEYTRGSRMLINNDRPIIGIYGVNYSGSGDMYVKGANMLHMIRKIIGNDEQWRDILRGLNKTFYHQTVTTDDVETYIIRESGIDLAPVFDQYLRDIRIPVLEYKKTDDGLLARWNNVVDGFSMPIDLVMNGNEIRIIPTTEWQQTGVKTGDNVQVHPDYYIATLEIR
ncbi:MAG: M1 family metallopeptidase [Cyclobacteriaceae bacterium]